MKNCKRQEDKNKRGGKRGKTYKSRGERTVNMAGVRTSEMERWGSFVCT